jgi:hypothetical protein
MVPGMGSEEAQGLRPREAPEQVMGDADPWCPADPELAFELGGSVTQGRQDGRLRKGSGAWAKLAGRLRSGREQAVPENGPEIPEAEHRLKPGGDPRPEALLSEEIEPEERVAQPHMLRHLCR